MTGFKECKVSLTPLGFICIFLVLFSYSYIKFIYFLKINLKIVLFLESEISHDTFFLITYSLIWNKYLIYDFIKAKIVECKETAV